MTIGGIMNAQGMTALAKIRKYSYLIFIFDMLLLVHGSIADVFKTSDNKIVYGFVALIFFQVTMGILLIIRYGMTVQNNKNKKDLLMYAARVRVFFTAQYAFLVVLVINQGWLHSYALDKITILMNVVMLVYVLKNCTILQRARY